MESLKLSSLNGIPLESVRNSNVVVACASLLLLVPSYAQKPESAQNPVFRVSSTLVQIDAVVTDAKGNQIPDLTANDFELYADGVPQPITHFSYVSISLPANQTAPAKDSAKNPLLAAPPAMSIRREEVRRTMVLMVDDLNLSFESLARVRFSLLKFVDEQMQPGDLVAVCRTGSGTSAFQQFTSDRRLAHAVINGLRWNPNGRYGISFFEPLSPDPHRYVAPAQTGLQTVDLGSKQGSPGMMQQLDHLRQNTLAGGALGAIDYVVQALRDMPGRKSVILFSDGLVIDSSDDFTLNALHRLVDRANRSGTVIYTMQGAGLQTLQPGAADNLDLNMIRHISEIEDRRGGKLFAAQSGLEYLSQLTGGLAYFNGNDLNDGLSRVLEDQKGYYLLGYAPPAGTFNVEKGERPYHKLKVVLKDKHLNVRSRTGFYGATDEETQPRFASAIEEIRAAMLSPFAASGVGLRLTPLYSEVPGRGPVVRSLLDIDAHDLTFKPILDGSFQAKIKLLAAAYGPDNKQLVAFGYDYIVTVEPGHMDEVLRDGALYNVQMALPKPGGFHIRVAVRDEETKRTGSANEFIDIPDARKKRLALSSVILAAAARSNGAESPSLGPSAARREFHRGEIVQYFSVLENGDPKHIAAADTFVQIRIVREGRQIYLKPARVVDLPDHKRAATGLLKLGEDLPTGDYFFQVVASLPKKPKSSPAEQWTDFAVLPN